MDKGTKLLIAAIFGVEIKWYEKIPIIGDIFFGRMMLKIAEGKLDEERSI